MRWNNRKLWRVFPVSVAKAITLSTLLRLLYADYTERLFTAAFCNLQNWVHRYTTEAHATNKICTLFLSRFFTQTAYKTLFTYFKNGLLKFVFSYIRIHFARKKGPPPPSQYEVMRQWSVYFKRFSNFLVRIKRTCSAAILIIRRKSKDFYVYKQRREELLIASWKRKRIL